MSVGEMIAAASRHRWRIAAALAAPPLLALTLLLVLPSSYRAESDIMVKTGREYLAQGTGETANLTAPSSTKQEGINSEVALLTGRAVTEATIAAVGLARLYPDIVESPPSSGTPMDAAVLRFQRDLAVQPVKLSNVIATSFDAASPAEARTVLDTLIRVYIQKHTAVFAGRRADGYRDSVERAMAEIRALDGRRSALKLTAGIADADTQRKELIHQRLDAERRLTDAMSRQARLRARLVFLTDARRSVPATAVSAATEQADARIHADQAVIDLQAREAELQTRLGGANPDLQRVRAQIAAVATAARGAHKERNVTTAPSPLRTQLEGDALGAGAELAATGVEIEHLRAFVDGRNAELARLERADLELRDLSLQFDAMTQNLRAMQGRYEQARADEQTDLARQVSVVQVAAAIGSEKPVGPRKLVFGSAGLLAGVLLAGLVAWLTMLFNKTALTIEAAERRVGLPVLAVLPFSDEPDAAVAGAR